MSSINITLDRYCEQLVDMLPLGVLIIDNKDLIIRYCNSPAASLLSPSPSGSIRNIAGTSLTDLLTETERTNIIRALEQVREGETRKLEMERYTTDRNLQYLKLAIVPQKNPLGEIVNFLITVEEISGQAEKSELLEDTRPAADKARFYESILDNIPIVMLYFNSNLMCLHMNEAAEKALGKARSEIIGKSIDIVFQNNRQAREGVINAIKTKTIFTVPAMPWSRLDHDEKATYYFTSFIPDRDMEGNVRGILTEAVDISSLYHEIGESIQQWERKFSLLSSSLPLYIWTVDTNLTYTSLYGNETLMDRLTEKGKNLVGQKVRWFTGVDETSPELIRYHREALLGKSIRTEYWSGYWYDLSIEPLQNEKGEITGAVGVAMDITERKALEKDLRERNQQLLDFTYSMNHDLKNSLNILGSYINLIRENPESCPKLISQLSDQFFDISSLVDVILLLARSGKLSGEKVDVDLEVVIREAILLNSIDSSNTRITLSLKEPRVKGDPKRIQEALVELISNSIQARDPEKEILEINISSYPVNSSIVISIQDNGIGIREEDKEKLFELSYTTRKAQSSGFGLPIVQNVVEAHSGKIWAESAGEHQGVTFFIQLPRS